MSSKPEIGVIRQYDFSHGPNYTDSIYSLNDKELAQSENVYWDGSLKTIPGAGRMIASTIAGTTHNFVGITQYVKKDLTSYYVVVTDQGRASYNSGGSWTLLKAG